MDNTIANAAAPPPMKRFMTFAQKRRGRALLTRGLALPSEPEDVESRSWLHFLQLRRALDEPLVPGAAHADQNGDILLAIDREGHRRRAHAAAGVELPQTLQGLRIERVHRTRRVSGELQVRSRQDSGEIRELRLMLAQDLAGRDVDRCDAARDPERLRRSAAGEEVARLVLLLFRLDRDAVAALDHGDVPGLELGIVSRRRPVLPA